MLGKMTMTALLLLCSTAAATDEERTFWLWAIDGRFERSQQPCSSPDAKTNPAHRAIIDWIGSETYVHVSGDRLSLTRGKTRVEPHKRLPSMALWYEGLRTWIVSVRPSREHPAFAVVTLSLIHI